MTYISRKYQEFIFKHGFFPVMFNPYNCRQIGDVSPTITTECGGTTTTATVLRLEGNMRIRKLTPKECWRLMGFDDEDFDKAQQVNSNSQLYKQAGNSVVVDILDNIFKNMVDYLK